MWWLPVLVVLRRQGPVPVHVGGRILIPFFIPFNTVSHCHYKTIHCFLVVPFLWVASIENYRPFKSASVVDMNEDNSEGLAWGLSATHAAKSTAVEMLLDDEEAEAEEVPSLFHCRLMLLRPLSWLVEMFNVTDVLLFCGVFFLGGGVVFAGLDSMARGRIRRTDDATGQPTRLVGAHRRHLFKTHVALDVEPKWVRFHAKDSTRLHVSE